MKIIYVNWAPLWMGAEEGGGVNLYQQRMAVSLARRGHEVYSVSAGFAYNLAGGIYLRRGPDHDGVINYEVVNAPNVAPGFFNFATPEADVNEPQIESVFSRLLTGIKPDLVHFNNVEGVSARCVAIARDQGARVVFSLHNYHPLCNQVYMLHQDQEICLDFQEGNRCLGCIAPPAKKQFLLKRKLASHINQFPDGQLLTNVLESLNRAVRTVAMGGRVARSILASIGERRRLQNWPVAELAGNPSTPSSTPFAQMGGQPYAERRREMIRCINQAHCVLAVSSWVNRVYQEHGVDPERLITCHIGSAIAEIGRQPRPMKSVKIAGDPVDVIFLGLASTPKGLPFVLDTLRDMDRSTLTRIRLHLFARGVWTLENRIKLLEKHLAGLSVQDGYSYNDLPRILTGMDVGIVPPIWWDNAPQVVFEMLALQVPVIGARIGGIPDFVRHGENGLLFQPGNGVELADQLTAVTSDPELIPRLTMGITPMKTIKEHTDELENIYQAVD